ncbi:hypothetical protein BX666DRAFT_2003459 [Dichotomocladium elegans]|nr:hypothetical protein BX666DRAFT_2003459 [Dichotomocladium elegans]
MIIAFAETFNQDDEKTLPIAPSRPLIYEDDTEFPPLNPLKEGWQLINDDTWFAHELIQEADGWETIARIGSLPDPPPPLYVEIASKKPPALDQLLVMPNERTGGKVPPSRIRRHYSSSMSCDESSEHSSSCSNDLDLHGQYKSPRRRQRRSMYMDTSINRRYPHLRHQTALHSPPPTISSVLEKVHFRMKGKQTHRTINKKTAKDSKLALVEQGLDWTVCH